MRSITAKLGVHDKRYKLWIHSTDMDCDKLLIKLLSQSIKWDDNTVEPPNPALKIIIEYSWTNCICHKWVNAIYAQEATALYEIAKKLTDTDYDTSSPIMGNTSNEKIFMDLNEGMYDYTNWLSKNGQITKPNYIVINKSNKKLVIDQTMKQDDDIVWTIDTLFNAGRVNEAVISKSQNTSVSSITSRSNCVEKLWGVNGFKIAEIFDNLIMHGMETVTEIDKIWVSSNNFLLYYVTVDLHNRISLIYGGNDNYEIIKWNTISNSEFHDHNELDAILKTILIHYERINNKHITDNKIEIAYRIPKISNINRLHDGIINNGNLHHNLESTTGKLPP